ncbi:hypothetical protein, partial [Streptomyces sp. DSM 40484]|uniref:hypothetical protein n=1 Tax=Streptomyces kroppenstedtii TaxID=3051181 RepID=UPI0028D14100
MDARTIMETLGHSTITMTLDTYAHVMGSTLRAAARTRRCGRDQFLAHRLLQRADSAGTPRRKRTRSAGRSRLTSGIGRIACCSADRSTAWMYWTVRADVRSVCGRPRARTEFAGSGGARSGSWSVGHGLRSKRCAVHAVAPLLLIVTAETGLA